MYRCKKYDEEEKKSYIEEYRNSEKSIYEYTRNVGIPASTFRGWLKEEKVVDFGEIKINNTINDINTTKRNAIVFVNENIKLELKDGYDKKLFRAIVEVLLDDK